MLVKTEESILTTEGLTDISYGGYLNGESFQQEGIIAFNGVQYAAYYNKNRHVCLSRRSMPQGAWQTLEFLDYEASLPSDAHNTISIGICPSDGTIHLAFDHHGSMLHYRASEKGLAYQSEEDSWSISKFRWVMNGLGHVPVDMVTYPRFLITPQGNMLFEYRYGTSGKGDQMLWEYDGLEQRWRCMGKYIEGIEDQCNAYPHGLNYDSNGRLHITWCWRETPNPSTNHDLLYAYSDDNGRIWRNRAGAVVAQTGVFYINKGTSGIKVATISENRGLINQEAQAIDRNGQVHVLLSHMPDCETDDADFESARRKCRYFHYRSNGQGEWQRNAMGFGVVLNFRGRMAFDSEDNLYAILPNLRIACAPASSNWLKWIMVHKADEERFFSDPLIDAHRLRCENHLDVVCHCEDGTILVLGFEPKR